MSAKKSGFIYEWRPLREYNKPYIKDGHVLRYQTDLHLKKPLWFYALTTVIPGRSGICTIALSGHFLNELPPESYANSGAWCADIDWLLANPDEVHFGIESDIEYLHVNEVVDGEIDPQNRVLSVAFSFFFP